MPATPHARLLARTDRLLRVWFSLGLLLIISLPAARGHSHWIGWLPYWLLLAPLVSLTLLHRARLSTRWIHWRQRTSRRGRRQAVRSTARVPLRHALQAALRVH